MSKLEGLLQGLIEATAERDIKYVKQAQAFVNKLDRHLRSKQSQDTLNLGRGSGWWGHDDTVWMGAAHIDKRLGKGRLHIAFQKVSQGKRGHATLGGAANVLQWLNQKVRPIHLYVIPDKDKLEDYVERWTDEGRAGKTYPPKKKIKLTQGQKEVLLHELIHIFDYIRGGAGIEKAAGTVGKLASGDKKAYFNDPKEYNAYFQEGLSRLMTVFNTQIKKAKTENPDILFIMLGHGYPDFATYLQHNPYWRQDWIENLNDKNRKKFKSRLFGLYKELAARAKKATGEKNDGFTQAALAKKHDMPMYHTEWPTRGSTKGKFTQFKPTYWGRKVEDKMSKLNDLLQEMKGRQELFWLNNRVIARAIKQGGLYGVSFRGVKDEGSDGVYWEYKWYDSDLMSDDLKMRVWAFESAAGPQVTVWLYDRREDIYESKNVKNERELAQVFRRDMTEFVEDWEEKRHKYDR